ncbi:MAG: putative transporter, periplasmic binding protein [Bradyrhizobium sp.]|nr:putative transporter, periplasmic binding protein [Bradyrhizobium sp.]
MRDVSIDRRLFLGGAGGILAAALAGCHHAVPIRSGSGKYTLVGLIGEDPVSLNPGISTAPSCLEAASPAYSGLLNMGPAGELSPCLASAWEISPDFKSFAFDLRTDVAWHDGKPFTAQDVKFTIEEVLSKLHPMGRTIYKNLDRVDIEGAHRAVIRLNKPYPRLLKAAFSFWPMLPKHLVRNGDIMQSPLARHATGTGAYKMVAYEPGNVVRFRRNEHYFEKNLPLFDEIVLHIVPSASAQLLAFQNGDVDFLHSSAVPTPNLPLIKSFPNSRLHLSSQMGGCYLATLNMRNPMLADVRVRRAMIHAIDRAFIRESVFPLISQPMVGPLWPASELYDHALPDYPFDPLQASQLLDEAGFYREASGRRFELAATWATSDLKSAKIADIMSQNLADVGIRLRLEPLERAAMTDRIYLQAKFDIAVMSFALGPDPDFGTERLYNSNNIKPLPFSNASFYKNPEVDKLFDEQRHEADPTRRRALYRTIQQKIWADLPTIPIASTSVSCVSNDRFVTDVFDANWTAQTDGMVHAKPGPDSVRSTVHT